MNTDWNSPMPISMMVFLLALVILFALVFWYRLRMRVSKAKFALTTVSAMVVCLLSFFAAISADFPVVMAQALLGASGIQIQFPGLDWFSILVLALLTGSAIYFIYRFSSGAIQNWTAPPRVSESILAEDRQENDLLRLAKAQYLLFIRKQGDPLASEHAISWDQKFPVPPKAIEQRILLRDLFQTSVREAQIPDEGWRDTHNLWIGGIHVESNTIPEPLCLLIFDGPPTEEQVRLRLESAKPVFTNPTSVHFFGAFPATKRPDAILSEVTWNGTSVRLASSRQLIFDSLDLRYYARELLRKFQQTKAGGTEATLSSSYVELNASSQRRSDDTRPLCDILEEWEAESSSRHLAVTGEFGQGKSTAMLKYCADWAEGFLTNSDCNRRVPLLIELRGHSPAETDPLSLISAWSARYGLLGEQVLNLIKSGEAVVVFEGFDELRNSGRAYDRHQHFNALWRFAYPNTKIVFTGRPNFLLDQHEQNRTLRSSHTDGSVGEAFTETWRLEKLSEDQIGLACREFSPTVKAGIQAAIASNRDFLEIMSRPSMLPVVATIWGEIEDLRQSGSDITGALLIERYLQAIYMRKERELEQDRVSHDSPSGSRYLVLPKPVREFLTVSVAWRMAGLRGQNTISRNEIRNMVGEMYEELFRLRWSAGVSPEIAEGLVQFEQRMSDDTLADRVDAITSEICSAGLLVPDPAGGSTNLQFPHKQFYEYLICKGFCIVRHLQGSPVAMLLLKSSEKKEAFTRLFREQNAIVYLSECIGRDVRIAWGKRDLLELVAVFSIALWGSKSTGSKSSYRKFLSQLEDDFDVDSGHIEEHSSEQTKPSSRAQEFHKAALLLEMYRLTDVSARSLQIFYVGIFVVCFSIGPIYAAFAFLQLLGPSEWVNVLAIVLGGALVLASMAASSRIRSWEAIWKGRAFLMFLYAHWSRQDPGARTLGEVCRLARASAVGGEVQFLDKPPEDKADISSHLSPARDFVRQ